MNDLKERTKLFSLSIIELVEQLPKSIPAKAVAYQLVKCGTGLQLEQITELFVELGVIKSLYQK